MSHPSSTTATPFIAAAVLFSLATYSILLTDLQTVQSLAGDERFVEMLGALAYAGASLCCFLAARRTRDAGSQHMQRVFLIGLGVVFFFACGEELSWGQHLLGFKTPEAIEHMNRQAEFNLHNLNIWDSRDETGARRGGLAFFLNTNRLLDYFMLSLFVVGPLLVAGGGALGRLARTLGFPAFDPRFAAPMLLNYAITAVSVLLSRTAIMSRGTSEIRESNSAFLCLMLAAYLWRSAASADDRR
jgi:hypothetical protein